MIQDLHAFIVCVDYHDLLALTLPYHRHHFETVTVITDEAHFAAGCHAVAAMEEYDPGPHTTVKFFVTESFYAQGAHFNKWKALEQALDDQGRLGWICLLDADVVWPTVIPELELVKGNLYGPLRRMLEDPRSLPKGANGLPIVPPEKDWTDYPIHKNVNEWAGYTQIFHADDPVLGAPPWHDVNWKHAGGADSFFQQKWPTNKKLRLPFEVLHLGKAGENWCGRVSEYLQGGAPELAEARALEVRKIWQGRRGRSGPGKFSHEKLG